MPPRPLHRLAKPGIRPCVVIVGAAAALGMLLAAGGWATLGPAARHAGGSAGSAPSSANQPWPSGTGHVGLDVGASAAALRVIQAPPSAPAPQTGPGRKKSQSPGQGLPAATPPPQAPAGGGSAPGAPGPVGGAGAADGLEPPPQDCFPAPVVGDAQRWGCRARATAAGDVYGNGFEGAAAAWAQYRDRCPPALTGSMTLLGNRIRLWVGVATASGVSWTQAILDTGAFATTMPDSFMRKAGAIPAPGTGRMRGVVPGAESATYRYPLPDASLVVPEPDGQIVPLGRDDDSVTVAGQVGGTSHLIGPDVLRQGATLTLDGPTWVLPPACF